MKTFFLVFISLTCASRLMAQKMDSLDNILLKIPAAWQVEKQATYILMTMNRQSPNSFCQVAVYQQQPAAADKNASFKKEWQEIVLTVFETSATASPQVKKTKYGNVLFYGAQATHKGNKLPYYTELHMFDCGNTVQSVMLVSGSKKHLQLFDSSWQSLITGVRKNSNNITQTIAVASNAPFTGMWSKSSSSPMGIDPASIITNVGYIKCQYQFKTDGTYTLHGEAGGGALRTNNFGVITENGTYTVNANQLVVIPAKSVLTATDRDGNVQKKQNLDVSKRTYTWQFHYFEGLNETQLVLRPRKEYFQDGGKPGGSSLFPDAYLYSKEYKPEWRIQLK